MIELPNCVYATTEELDPQIYEKVGDKRFRARLRPCIHRTIHFVRKPCGAYENKITCSFFQALIPIPACV